MNVLIISTVYYSGKIIEIINKTRGGIVIFFSENKRECGDYWGGGQIPVPGVGPSANWLN